MYAQGKGAGSAVGAGQPKVVRAVSLRPYREGPGLYPDHRSPAVSVLSRAAEPHSQAASEVGGDHTGVGGRLGVILTISATRRRQQHRGPPTAQEAGSEVGSAGGRDLGGPTTVPNMPCGVSRGVPPLQISRGITGRGAEVLTNDGRRSSASSWRLSVCVFPLTICESSTQPPSTFVLGMDSPVAGATRRGRSPCRSASVRTRWYEVKWGKVNVCAGQLRGAGRSCSLVSTEAEAV